MEHDCLLWKNVWKIPIVFLLFVSFIPSVQSATLTVCGSGCNSTTIQGAIDLAVSGDTVEVASGTYNESLIINKPLNLEGAKANIDSRGGAWGSSGLSTINAGEGNNGILITASDVTVNGFKIIESGSDAEIFSLNFPFESAVYAYNESAELENVAIIYNWIDDNYGSGIVVRYAKEPVVEYNYISKNGAGVWASAGIGGQELTNGSFSYNEVANSISYGLYFGGGKVGSTPKNTTGTLISYNNFHDNEKYGLQLYGYYDPSEVSNYGIRLENNIFQNNGRCGIKVTDFTGTSIKYNDFINNGGNGTSDKYKYGALVSAYYTASETQFSNNTFTENELGGIYLLLELEGADLSEIVATHNNFLDDGIDIITATRGVFDFPFVINAENNWWGAIPNSSEFQENVIYYPFCLNLDCVANVEDINEEFTGSETTNFSTISNWSEVDLNLESDAGMINWTFPVDLSGSNLLFTDAISISSRKISIDTGAMPELNHPAILTFRTTGFSNTGQFKIMRNGVKCPNTICTSYRIDNGTVELSVNQLSSYTLSESTKVPLSGTIPLIAYAGLLIFMLSSLFVATTGDIKEHTDELITVLVTIVILVLFVSSLSGYFF
jgi:parallel beta-helix repeat protein